MARQVALLRTHQFGTAERRLIATLRDGFGDDIVLCFDTQNGPPPADFAKTVALTPDLLADLDLVFPPDWAWRCGDFCHYAAARAFPDYDHYWLFEPDVAFNKMTVGDFLARTDASDADFLASASGPANTAWPHAQTVPGVFKATHQCFFPITRLSARAIAQLLLQRRAMGRDWQAQGLAETLYANDEAFVATAIATTPGLTFQPFRTLAPEFFPQHPPMFSWRRSVLDIDMAHLPPGILHPVIDQATFESRILGPASRSWNKQDADYLKAVLERHYAPDRAQQIFDKVRWRK